MLNPIPFEYNNWKKSLEEIIKRIPDMGHYPFFEDPFLFSKAVETIKDLYV